MKTLRFTIAMTALFGLSLIGSAVNAQDYERDYDQNNDRGQVQADDYYESASIDRYLDVEVWTDHADADYYTGDEVVVNFRVNRDAFVAIYSIDSRGMVNLLFPADPAQDNFVRGGESYSIPGPQDDYELVLNGPEGTEHIQVVASRERFPIPDWYHNSGLVFSGDDIYDYMDWLNGRYFVRYSGQRFAYDRAVVFVNEWEPDYFRPVYYPNYPSWAVVGNVYLDYPWGSTVYINGYYWGVTPLYVPRILVGWHTLTIYDNYGGCWEHDFHVSRYHTTVFDRTIIRTSPSVRSKYTTVASVGYRDPVSNGYKNYSKVVQTMKTRATTTTTTRGKVVKNADTKSRTGDYVSASKKYVRGETKLVKTDRGYESRGATSSSGRDKASYGSNSSSKGKGTTSRSSTGTASDSYTGSKSTRSSGDNYSGSSKSSKSGSSGSGSYYKRKSGSSSSSSRGTKSTKTIRTKTQSSGSSAKSPSKGSTLSKPKQTSKGSTSDKSTPKVSQPKSSTKEKSSTSKSSTSKDSSSKKSSSSKGKSKR